jgi:alpha-beta hydrolase superfamily lysophospholipase
MNMLTKDLNVSRLTYDYLGYGDSRSSDPAEQAQLPNEQSTYQTMDMVLQYVVQKLGFLPEQIVLIGHSLGGGPSIYAASQLSAPPKALMLISTFSSAIGIVSGRLARLAWRSNIFQNELNIALVRCPILIVHAKDDWLISVEESNRLYRAVLKSGKAPVWHVVFRAGGHVNLIQKNQCDLRGLLCPFLN